VRRKLKGKAFRFSPFLLAALHACADSPTSPGPAGPAALEPAARSLALSADPVFVGAGDIHADCVANGDSITAALLDGIDGTVFTTGDNTEHGTAADYANCYEPRWGRHKARTRPALGDNDVLVAGAGPYFGYFGSAAGPAGQGYYSYNLGDWHIIVLDSNQPSGTTSPQYLWLKDDLESHPGACSLAIWHEARFSSTRVTLNGKMKAIWKLLDNEGADLVLNGHAHVYERFAPQDVDGNADPNGIRQFTLGTGGKRGNPGGFDAIKPNSQVRQAATLGVLKLTLHSDSYDWEFVAEPGSSFTDTGTGGCVDQPQAPTADPGGPYAGGEGSPIAFTGAASFDPDGGALSYAWDYGDGGNGLGLTASHAYDDDATYTLSLTVTDPDGLSDSATTTVTVANVAPSATFEAPGTVPPGTGFSIALTGATDPSPIDAAAGFEYAFDCGTGYGAWGPTASANCPGVATGPVQVRGKIRDVDLSPREYTATVQIGNNLAPIAVAGGPYSSLEGSSLLLSGAGSSDPNGDPLTYAWDFGDGSVGSGLNPSHAYADNGSYVVTLVVADPGGLKDTISATATVSNVKPAGTFNRPSSLTVGTPYTLSITDPSDPSPTDTAAGFTYRFNCGSGMNAWSTNPSRSCPARLLIGTIKMVGKIRDKDGAVKTYTKKVNVTLN
jgi:PKD repeat protein